MLEHISTPAHRLQDAAQAIVYTAGEWITPKTAGESPNGFTYAELTDLHAWVALLAHEFPSASEGGPALQPELVELKDRLATEIRQIEEAEGQGALCHDRWLDMLKPLR